MQKDANGLKNFRKTFEKIIDNREEYDIITTVFFEENFASSKSKTRFFFQSKTQYKKDLKRRFSFWHDKLLKKNAFFLFF